MVKEQIYGHEEAGLPYSESKYPLVKNQAIDHSSPSINNRKNMVSSDKNKCSSHVYIQVNIVLF